MCKQKKAPNIFGEREKKAIILNPKKLTKKSTVYFSL